MTEREKERAIWVVGIGGAVVVLLWLWYRAQGSAATGTPATGTAQNPVIQLGNPVPQINLNLQSPNFTNQATGYVPLFGFLGYSGRWQ